MPPTTADRRDPDARDASPARDGATARDASLARDRATELTRRRYDRLAPHFDLMEWSAERGAFKRWRPALWSLVQGPRILEVGVGTGKNIPHYPAGADVTAIDLSPAMITRARARAAELGSSVDIREMDAQALDFPDDTFDSVVTSCVFCSVPDPVLGLREIRRVLKPGGRLLMLEHVLSNKPVLQPAMRAVNPVVVRMMGANIDRRTRRNIEAAGLVVERETDLWLDVVKLFEVRKPAAGSETP